MKRFLPLLLLILLLGLAGCREKAPEELKTTVMVYMVGSDLESKSGAGTQDLEEMLASCPDLTKTNVLVYAGGATKWHNDIADPEKHSLMLLTEDGFQTITSSQTYSMGDAQCLSTFLLYGYHNFPADQYALILWDHGNGPVIGYGKDMLFNNDRLTLREMEEALEASPFGGETRLAWVGFDACLMASAELAGVWAPYADYLVASQEVEPAFGWNYSFLSQATTADTPGLLAQLADGYLNTCLAYYEERGYQDRDTTLSCVDLRKMDQLEAAMEALFSRATADISAQYNQLTARRAQTRSLGRASTGSEYDLVDLMDMGMWLGQLYPQEVTQLQAVLQDMTLVNANNTGDLCGMSLYYPFHNKDHYESGWADTYRQLGLFPAYQAYLESYQAIWLENDKLELATSDMPTASQDAYTLQLTPEQRDNLASAKYYILTRDGEEYFTQIFSSSHVTNDNGLLTAGFDGNVLYVTNDFGDYFIPVSTENDRVGDMGRYSVRFNLSNFSLDSFNIPENYEKKSQTHRYTLNIDKATGQVTVSSLQPFEKVDGDDVLIGGKVEDVSLEGWTNALFLHDSHRFLSRYPNGAIMPVDQWPVDTVISGYGFALENGLEFVYRPLVAGEYYLLFEMEDTQGNRYCSDLLPIQTEGELPQPPAENAPTQLDWNKNEKLLLTEAEGVSVWLTRTDSYVSGYALEVENNTDVPVEAVARDLYADNDLYCREYFTSAEAAPGETGVSDYGSDLGPASDLGLGNARELRFTLYVQNGITLGTTHHETFRIRLSDQTQLPPDTVTTAYYSYTQPIYQMLAEKQVLAENDRYRVTLLGMGGNGQDSYLRMGLEVENLTDNPLLLTPEGLRLNDLYLLPYYNGPDLIPAHSRSYATVELSSTEPQQLSLTSVAQAAILLREEQYNPLFSGNSLSELSWHDVALSQSGPASQLPESTLLYEEKGVRVILLPEATSLWSGHCYWRLVAFNHSGQDISLDVVDALADGKSLPEDAYFNIDYVGSIPDGMAATYRVFYSNYSDEALPETITFRFRIMDFKGEAILYTAEQAVTLTIP